MNNDSLPPLPAGIACSIESLDLALKCRDSYTQEHSNRVSILSLHLASRCGLTAEACERLALAARFHDIGKIGIPDRILLHPGRLDADDYRVMQLHSVFGEHIFLASRHRDTHIVAAVIRQHHEAMDGSGYPDGLHTEQISLEARILRIADCYDAMTSHRNYRANKKHSQAMQTLREECGSKIDPELFAEFERLPVQAIANS